MSFEPEARMIASLNGVTIGYDDVGTGENVLVLVHGHPFDRDEDPFTTRADAERMHTLLKRSELVWMEGHFAVRILARGEFRPGTWIDCIGYHDWRGGVGDFWSRKRHERRFLPEIGTRLKIT